MGSEGLAIVDVRRQFYRDGHRRVMAVLLLSIVINLILAGILLYIVANPPKPKYFATSIEGRITPITSLSQPNQTDGLILQWASQAAITVYTFNFVNYRKELQNASDFFTAGGWKEFMKALDSSNNLEAVKEKKLVVSAVVTQAPVILQKGVLKGRYAWRIQMPILVTYQSASEFSQQNNVVTMLVTRVSTLNSPQGIGIEQFVVRSANSIM